MPQPGEPDGAKRDNPIALASLLTSVLALILAVIVIGGVLGIISFVLAIVALRRSSELESGKMLAITAMGLSIIAVFAAALATIFWVAQTNTGEDFVIDGITSSSNNLEFPPQEDLDEIVCTTSDGGDSALAVITITNRSGGPSNYIITVAWLDDTDREIVDVVRSESVPTGESETLRLFAPRSNVDSNSCRVDRLERWFLAFGR